MQPYAADPSLKGKLRRRYARLTHRRPARLTLDRPVVSFTFDDVPESAVHEGAPVLEAEGVRGTWYLCAGLFGKDGHMGRFADAGDARRLASAGHEVACHTRDHIDCHRADDDRLLADVEANVAALRELGGSAAHFAFPYGEVGPRAKRLLGPRYGSLRGVHAGLVHDGGDRNQLPAVGIEGDEGEARARHWIDRAVAEKAWLILFTHDVRAEPSPWGCTPEALGRLVRYAGAQGCDIRTVGEVLA